MYVPGMLHTGHAPRTGGFPVLLMHGKHDLIAAPGHAEALARRLGTRAVMLSGAHFITRERSEEVRG